LHLAVKARECNPAAVQLLLDAKADITARNASGLTAHDIAKAIPQRRTLVTAIERHEATIRPTIRSVSFLLGLHPRAGKNAVLQQLDSKKATNYQNDIFDPQALRIALRLGKSSSSLFTPPKPAPTSTSVPAASSSSSSSTRLTTTADDQSNSPGEKTSFPTAPG